MFNTKRFQNVWIRMVSRDLSTVMLVIGNGMDHGLETALLAILERKRHWNVQMIALRTRAVLQLIWMRMLLHR